MSTFLQNKWTSFKADTRGNFVMIAAVAFPVVAFSIGSAVDLANFRLASTAAQAAVDTASLAASRAITVEDATLAAATDIAREQLSLNISNVSFIDQDVVENSLRLEQDLNTGTLTASVDVQTPTLFAAIFGFDSLSTTLSSTNQVQSLEIAFVLDNTGSMRRSISGNSNNNERIDALRAAMENAVDLLLPVGRVNDSRVRASIVPYSAGVTMGDTFYEATVGPDAPDSPITCVTEREGEIGFTDVPPTLDQEDTYFETDAAIINLDAPCPQVAIRPLTSDRDELFETIDALDTSGTTAGHNGVHWGVNTLSPAYQDFWTAEVANSDPAEYLTSNVRKILVVMTDGDFNTTFQDEIAQGDFNTARGRDAQGDIIPDLRELTVSTSEGNTLNLCNEAKSASRGVVVYTITLGDNERARNLMAECATNPSTTLIAESAEELNEAFERIVVEARTPILTN